MQDYKKQSSTKMKLIPKNKNFVGGTEKACTSKEAYNPVTSVPSREIPASDCGRRAETFDPS